MILKMKERIETDDYDMLPSVRKLGRVVVSCEGIDCL